jgi:hypothetical protein
MIRLVVQNQVTNELQELDTFGNENIALTLQVDDVRDIESKNASYSKDFNLPATKTNNKFFEHFYNLDRYSNNYNVYKNVKAFLYTNDVLVLEGYLRLLNVVEKSTEITYNVVLFNDVANIIESLADATINDLDFTDINHEFNATNIINSWAGVVALTQGGTTDNVYYPLINDGQIYADNENLYIDYKQHYVLNVNLKYIIDKIFNYAGFIYDSNFFNSTYFKDIFFDTGRNNNTSDFATASITADTGSGTDNVGVNPATAIGDSLANATVIDFVNESGDTDGVFNHDTSVFTAPYDCYLNINYTVKIYNTVDFQFGVLRLYANDTQIGYTSINEAPALGQVTVKTHTFTGSIYVSEGDDVTLQFFAPFAELHIANANAELNLQILDVSTDSKVKSNRGDIKLADILKDVVTAFNLTIESKQNNLLKIEPYNDFINNNTLDWTQKVNINEMVVEPIEIPKRIEFKHAEDSDDYYHQQFKKTQLTDYGKQSLEFDVDSDETKQIELSVFAAPFIKELDNTNINLQHIATSGDETLEPFDNAPRLIFKNVLPFDIELNIQDVNEGEIFGVGYKNINSGTPYKEFINNIVFNDPLTFLTVGGSSLLFGYTNPTYTPLLNAIPVNTLFNTHWFSYINEKFNVTNGLILKTELYLKPSDISTFSFGNPIKIQDQLYRVNKIEYNTDENSLAKVELLRI